MKTIVLFFALSLALFSCSSNNVDLAIDNPTDMSIIVKVDTLTVEIPANEVVWVEMGKGEHTITLEDGSVTKFNFTEAAYMLNPTKSEYLKFEEFFGSAAYQNMYTHRIPSQTVNFYGMELEGNYEVIKDLINPITWEYGPREELPSMIETEENYEVMLKLMDVNEFIKLMEQYQSESYDEYSDEEYLEEVFADEY